MVEKIFTYFYPYKKLLFIVYFLLQGLIIQAQTYTVTVTNGYGSGQYHPGDTVDVWSIAIDTTQVFSNWSGDTTFLSGVHEWHNSFIMPAQSVNLIANLQNMPSYTIHFEQIKGRDRLKRVYYCLPTNMSGVIYLFHGTGGNARGWIDKVEGRSFVDAAIASNFGIIVTEAEEITLNTDLNGDGKLRWSTYPLDSVGNIDHANIKAINDTMINRGLMTYATPRFSLGMSNGGAYSSGISFLFQFRAGISYCASGTDTLFALTQVPFAFRMARFDDNAEVGPEGNYEAWQHDSTLNARGVCHDYLIHDRQRIYPESFARIPGISVSLSQSIFNELLTNNQINAAQYAISSTLIQANVLSNPTLYPVIMSLPAAKRLEILNQTGTSNAEHNFFSDYNYASLQFFIHLCNSGSPVEETGPQKKILIFPNPASETITLQIPDTGSNWVLTVFDLRGRPILQKTINQVRTKIEVNNFAKGLYIVKMEQAKQVVIQKLIIE